MFRIGAVLVDQSCRTTERNKNGKYRLLVEGDYRDGESRDYRGVGGGGWRRRRGPVSAFGGMELSRHRELGVMGVCRQRTEDREREGYVGYGFRANGGGGKIGKYWVLVLAHGEPRIIGIRCCWRLVKEIERAYSIECWRWKIEK